jgi:hypothetical protein
VYATWGNKASIYSKLLLYLFLYIHVIFVRYKIIRPVYNR